MELTETQILNNWTVFIGNIQQYISEPRRTSLLKMYNDFKDELIIAPGSGNLNYHNCFPGGYIDHVNRVVNCSILLYETWKLAGASILGFTKEELVFSAINHDLGKAGEKDKPYYIPNPSEWHRKNQGAMYELNTNLTFMKVPDRSLFTLQKYNISISENEYLAIKLHDGMYNDANKGYYMAFKPEFGLQTNLCYILHHADHLASRIEHDNKHKAAIPIPAINNNLTVDELFSSFNKK